MELYVLEMSGVSNMLQFCSPQKCEESYYIHGVGRPSDDHDDNSDDG